MTLGTGALSRLPTGSVIGVNPTPEPMRQVEYGLIGSDVEIADKRHPEIAKIYAGSTGSTEWRKSVGSTAFSERISKTCRW